VTSDPTPTPDLAPAPPLATAAAPAGRRGLVRRLYDWTIGWADRPGGTWALFTLSVAESSFFPIPPDVLLMALCIGRPRRSLWFAAVCTAGSVIGGVIGYYIGFALFEQLGRPVLEAHGALDKFDWVGEQ
jgi:membrane protein YqaA with SNARE-associated domain